MDCYKSGCLQESRAFLEEKDILDSINIDIGEIKKELIFTSITGIRGYQEKLNEITRKRENLKVIEEKLKKSSKFRKENGIYILALCKIVEFTMIFFVVPICLGVFTRNNKMFVDFSMKYCFCIGVFIICKLFSIFLENKRQNKNLQVEKRLQNYRKSLFFKNEAICMIIQGLEGCIIIQPKDYLKEKKIFAKADELLEEFSIKKPVLVEESLSSGSEGDVDEPQPNSGNSSDCF